MDVITEKTSKILDILIPEGDLDYKIRRVLLEDIARKLAGFQLIDNRFRKKYGMTLEEFEERNIVRVKGLSFEVESDYHEWDSAVDEIKALIPAINDLSMK